MVEVAELERLIALVEARVDAAGPAPASGCRYEEHKSHWKRGDEIVAALIATEGAKYRPPTGGSAVLTMAGVRTSCTSGAYGLLANWTNAARRQIAAAKGGA